MAVILSCLLCPGILAVVIMWPFSFRLTPQRLVERAYPEYGLSFSVPMDWEMNEVFVTEGSGVYIKVSTDLTEYGSHGVVVLHLGDEDLDRSLATTSDPVLVLESLPVEFNYGILEQSKTIKVDGYPGARRMLLFDLNYDYLYYFVSWQLRGTMLQAVILHENDVVEFFATCTEGNWDEFRLVFLQILESLHFTG